jgi:O-antigen ligase
MTVCLSVALALFLSIRSTVAKAVLAGCVALALGGVFLSLSRAAFLALACIWVFWLVRSGRAGALRWVVPAMLLAVGAILAAPETVVDRIDTMVNPQLRKEDESIQSRFVTGMWGFKAFASNPLLGVGANRFPVWVQEHPEAQGLPFYSIHNAYLSLAAELGLFGLVPFVGMLVLTWADYAKCWRLARARRMLRDPALNEYATYSVALQAALLGCMVSAMFHQTHQSKPLWTVLAMSPVLVGLIRARIEELGTVTRDEPSLFPAFSDAAPLPAGRLPARS